MIRINSLNIREAILVLFVLMGKIVGRTKLQKTVYLLEREKKITTGLDFKIYLYGPFSKDLNNEVDRLISENLIQVNLLITHSGDKCYEYNISEKGRKVALKILDILPKAIREKFVEHASKFNSMTPTEIVQYVYSNYPDSKPKELSNNQ